MKITRANYESFFLDYIEGNLPEGMIDQFLDFLNQNPDLKEELHLFEEVNLPEEHVVFQEKKQLHKNETDENRNHENTVIAYLEGDLNDDENNAFETYIAGHPELKKEYDLFAKTRLKPDFEIKYPKKSKLYRKSGPTIVMKWVARAAAVLVLIWGINTVIQTQNTPESGKRNQEVVGVSPKPVYPVRKAVSEKIDQELAVPVKNKPEIAKNIQSQTKVKPKETLPVEWIPLNRDLTTLAQITPIVPQLGQGSTEMQLSFSHPVNEMKINEPKKVMSVEEFLADRAKKVGKEGLFLRSANCPLGFESGLRNFG